MGSKDDGKAVESEDNEGSPAFEMSALKYQANVQGAVLYAIMKTIAAMQNVNGVEDCKLRTSLFFATTPAILCYLLQIGFIYSIHTVDYNEPQDACSVGVWLKLCSVALFLISVYSVTVSPLTHSKIIFLRPDSVCRLASASDGPNDSEKEWDSLILSGTFEKIALFCLCVVPEAVISCILVPVGVVYISSQPTMESTIMASVALLFIVQIDECLYSFFPSELRSKIEDAEFDVNGYIDWLDWLRSAGAYSETGKFKKLVTEESKVKDEIKAFLEQGAEPILKLYLVTLASVAAVAGLRDTWLNCDCWKPAAPSARAASAAHPGSAPCEESYVQVRRTAGIAPGSLPRAPASPGRAAATDRGSRAQVEYFYIASLTVLGVFFLLPLIIASSRASATKMSHHSSVWKRQRKAWKQLRATLSV